MSGLWKTFWQDLWNPRLVIRGEIDDEMVKKYLRARTEEQKQEALSCWVAENDEALRETEMKPLQRREAMLDACKWAKTILRGEGVSVEESLHVLCDVRQLTRAIMEAHKDYY